MDSHSTDVALEAHFNQGGRVVSCISGTPKAVLVDIASRHNSLPKLHYSRALHPACWATRPKNSQQRNCYRRSSKLFAESPSSFLRVRGLCRHN